MSSTLDQQGRDVLKRLRDAVTHVETTGHNGIGRSCQCRHCVEARAARLAADTYLSSVPQDAWTPTPNDPLPDWYIRLKASNGRVPSREELVDLFNLVDLLAAQRRAQHSPAQAVQEQPAVPEEGEKKPLWVEGQRFRNADSDNWEGWQWWAEENPAIVYSDLYGHQRKRSYWPDSIAQFKAAIKSGELVPVDPPSSSPVEDKPSESSAPVEQQRVPYTAETWDGVWVRHREPVPAPRRQGRMLVTQVTDEGVYFAGQLVKWPRLAGAYEASVDGKSWQPASLPTPGQARPTLGAEA